MINIHGASVAPIDAAHLPWAENGGAGPNFLIPIAVAISAVLAILNFAGYTALPLYVVLAPPVLLGLHVFSFIRTRNAVHLALSAFAHDERLRALVAESAERTRIGHLSQDRLNAVTRGYAE